MPQEERKISIAWAIPAVLLLAVGGGMALALAVSRAAPPTVYTCPHCGAEFDTEEELLAHIELEHPELPPPALANLYGVVTDAETGAPLANVSVQLWSPDGAELLLFTTTDSGGYYSMANISPGSYLIRLEKEGYEAVVSDIALVEGNNELNVEMLLIRVAAPQPFTFSNVWVRRVRCESATAWNTLNFGCTITNPTDRSITHTLTPMYRVETKSGYSDPMPCDLCAFTLTLKPGQSYNCNIEGNYYDAEDRRWRCAVLLGFSAGVPYGGCAFLRDENGNNSPEACV